MHMGDGSLWVLLDRRPRQCSETSGKSNADGWSRTRPQAYLSIDMMGAQAAKNKQQQRQDFGRMRVLEFTSISCLIPQTRQNKRLNLTCFKECWKQGMHDPLFACLGQRKHCRATANNLVWITLQSDFPKSTAIFKSIKTFLCPWRVVPTSTYSSNTDMFPSSGECQNHLQLHRVVREPFYQQMSVVLFVIFHMSPIQLWFDVPQHNWKPISLSLNKSKSFPASV